MYKRKNAFERNYLLLLIPILFGLFLLQYIVGAFLIYSVALQETYTQLTTIAHRVNEDIIFTNGKWDTHRYDADPELPGTSPLYIFASDGFVIDRWKPIHGFLDTSDAKKLLSYTSPRTISTDTNQTWRVLSQPILSKNQNVGVLTVAFFNPSLDNLDAIDTQLQDSAKTILGKITVTDGQISTKNLDVRDINYNVVFQIVDTYNRIITKTDNTNSIDRIPNFIDTSYIGDSISSPAQQTLQDSVTGEKFLLLSKPIINSQHTTIGVIVVGKSIAFLSTILRDYLLAEGLLGILLTCIVIAIIFKLSKRFAKTISSNQHKPNITSLSFDKKSGHLFINNENIAFPYATNQYYLLSAIFSSPKKHWESDEILEKFGEINTTHARKVYDAMTLINKKLVPFFAEKLILIKDKRYYLNPQLITKLR